MRAYTLSILTQLADTGSPIVEKEIIDWVNNKLAQGKKTTSIRNFQVKTKNNSIENNKRKCWDVNSTSPSVDYTGLFHCQSTSGHRLD
jgi:hypothetical protein